MYNLLVPVPKNHVAVIFKKAYSFDYLNDFSNVCLRVLVTSVDESQIFIVRRSGFLVDESQTVWRIQAWFIGFSLSGVMYCGTCIYFYFKISFIKKTRRRCAPFVSRWIRHRVIWLQISILRYARRLTLIRTAHICIWYIYMSFGKFHKSIVDWWMAGGGEGRLKFKFRRLFSSHQTKIAIHYEATSVVFFFL